MKRLITADVKRYEAMPKPDLLRLTHEQMARVRTAERRLGVEQRQLAAMRRAAVNQRRQNARQHQETNRDE